MPAVRCSMADLDVVASLREIVGADGLGVDDAVRDSFAYDALGAQRGFDALEVIPPIAVVRPANAEQVAAIVRLANERGVPIVPYGGGSGLMGGARSVAPGLVLDMKRMSAVREIDVESGFVWAEAGAVLAEVDAEVARHGLMIGHDPWTFSVATIGGAISTNGLGFLGGTYGSMGEQVLAIEGVLADGAIVRTRPVQPRSTGFDLRHLFVGTEGAYGVLTAAAVRAFPRPEARELRGFHFDRFEDGFAAILAMRRSGITPTVLDYGERPQPARDRDVEPPTLYVGFDGLHEQVDACAQRSSDIIASHGGTPVDDDDVRGFWDTRHTPAENFARRRAQGGRPRGIWDGDAAFDYVHVSLPPSSVLRYRERALDLARRHEVEVIEAGVWVSPGLFSLVLLARGGGSDAATAKPMASAVDACLRLAHESGGSMEYCHGVGVRLAHLMDEEHGAGLAVLRRMKETLDPRAVLNVGKFALG